MKKNLVRKGKVILVGAGPGDPELITLKALRYLQQAEVVISDRLVSDYILDEYVNKDALVLHAGKQGGFAESSPQSLIHELMAEYATQGKLVVRLKGGDVTIFSNLLDELNFLSDNRIPFEIIPGITAASGAAAYAGIPLTARQYAKAVRFMTYHKKEILEPSDWDELAKTEDTLVFYMSSANVDELVSQLVGHGIGTDRSISIVEQATTPFQGILTCGIHQYLNSWKDRLYASPTLIIIGKVATLQTKFEWLGQAKESKHYFKPLRKNMEADARA
jgi:uroporphyrin-III C-methyltransferase